MNRWSWTLRGSGVLLMVGGVLSSQSLAVQDGTPAATFKIGLENRRFTPREPYNWRAAQTHALVTVVWYPADAGAVETPTDIPGVSNIFHLGSAARGARLAPAPAKFPLLVVSHGTGGSGLSMAWFCTALAARGYVVAAVNHPGNNATEPYTVEGFATWWERSRDLTEVISAMLADSEFGSRIDAGRIGAAGFSLGGYTMIEIAGGITDPQGFFRYCDAHPDDGICKAPPEFPTIFADFAKVRQQHPDFLNHAGASYRDARVRAVFAMAPALGPALPADRLKQIAIPVQIVAGQADQNVPVASSAEYLAATIPGAGLHLFPGNVGHYTFLDTCPASGKQSQPILCTDGAGVDRDAIHAATVKLAEDFFSATLK